MNDNMNIAEIGLKKSTNLIQQYFGRYWKCKLESFFEIKENNPQKYDLDEEKPCTIVNWFGMNTIQYRQP